MVPEASVEEGARAIGQQKFVNSQILNRNDGQIDRCLTAVGSG